MIREGERITITMGAEVVSVVVVAVNAGRALAEMDDGSCVQFSLHTLKPPPRNILKSFFRLGEKP